VALEPWRVADGVDDRRGRQQARDDREQDRLANAEQPDERERQQRPADGAEVVHRALEAVGTTVRARGYDVGEQRVPRRDS